MNRPRVGEKINNQMSSYTCHKLRKLSVSWNTYWLTLVIYNIRNSYIHLHMQARLLL